MSTDTSERGLERLICEALTGHPCDLPDKGGMIEAQPGPGSAGWVCGNPNDYNREYCVDLIRLNAFLNATQPEVAGLLALDEDGITQKKFLKRLQDEITKHGTIHVLRKGIKHEAHSLNLFYGTPSAGNEEAGRLFEANCFSVTRQLRYSRDETQRALDMGLFINGLPIATLELKNRFTGQSVKNAIEQYKRDRNPSEKLFELGRCIVHFAVDDQEVYFCTHLEGKASQFLPFNLGCNDGAGNPPNPNGIQTDYLWREVLTRKSLTNILESYAQVVQLENKKTGRRKKTQVWPRYHQLDVVRKLLDDVGTRGAGQRYMVQHSAGSGKSNSIAWLAYQLVGLRKKKQSIFDSIIVITDRRILDKQICDTIEQYAQVKTIVGHAENSADLREFIENGKKIVISTVQKFPFVLDEIDNHQRERKFAIIIDEAHSSQGGKTSEAVTQALSAVGEKGDEESLEDEINRLMESRKLLSNASYFAFTATPKNKTLEIFGVPQAQGDGAVKHRPFHSYTMKQAIQEGFILDVLKHYTPVESYCRLAKTARDDPKFDTKKAYKKLRRHVEARGDVIELKAQVMVDHFHEQVFRPKKVGGQARAMVVTNGVYPAIQYFHAIKNYLIVQKSPHKAIVAFSGESEYNGKKVSETSLNGFSSTKIVEKFREDPYRFLICADKFQTGYDEPLLHTMYVDKKLSGIKAVQTLSRLNRAHPKKSDVFVLDFFNDIEAIRKSFADFYRTTILADEIDPNKLHNLQADLDAYQVYSPEQIDSFVELYLKSKERERLDPILDECSAHCRDNIDESGQVEFRSKIKAFIRTYNFLSLILPYNNAEWEKRSIFFNFLVAKLPLPVEEDLSKGILNVIDIDTYRIEKQATQSILLSDSDTEIDPISPLGRGHKPEAELDYISNIIKEFNDKFGNISPETSEQVCELVTKEIPDRVSQDNAYRNARENSDEENARIENRGALERVVADMSTDSIKLFGPFWDQEAFRHFVADAVFKLTYKKLNGQWK